VGVSSALTLQQPVVRLIHDLEASGALTPTALDLSSRPDLPLETCTALAAFFGQVNHSSRWWIGDLLEFVEMRHGEYVAHVADATGLAPQTIENIMSVCRRVPPSRRRPGVPFSLHAEVAALAPQEQSKWLEVAESEKLTKTELRARLRPNPLPPARRQITCPRCGERIDV
jgi:hypothetical protein